MSVIAKKSLYRFVPVQARPGLPAAAVAAAETCKSKLGLIEWIVTKMPAQEFEFEL